MYYILNSLAFWLDVIWSLLVMSRFITLFVSGALIPVSIMPDAFRGAFFWLFPYWTICAPIEICMGREGPEFARGVLVLLGSAILLEGLRSLGLAARGAPVHRERNVTSLRQARRIVQVQFVRIGVIRKSQFRLEFFNQVVMDCLWYATHILTFEILFRAHALDRGVGPARGACLPRVPVRAPTPS